MDNIIKEGEQINKATQAVLDSKEPVKEEPKKDNVIILSIRQNLDTGRIDCAIPDNIQMAVLLQSILDMNIKQMLHRMLNPVDNKPKIVNPMGQKISNLMKRRIF